GKRLRQAGSAEPVPVHRPRELSEAERQLPRQRGCPAEFQDREAAEALVLRTARWLPMRLTRIHYQSTCSRRRISIKTRLSGAIRNTSDVTFPAFSPKCGPTTAWAPTRRPLRVGEIAHETFQYRRSKAPIPTKLPRNIMRR